MENHPHKKTEKQLGKATKTLNNQKIKIRNKSHISLITINLNGPNSLIKKHTATGQMKRGGSQPTLCVEKFTSDTKTDRLRGKC